MKLTYLELYPGETLLKGRLGQLIWETYSGFEADFANISSAKVFPISLQLRIYPPAAISVSPRGL